MSRRRLAGAALLAAAVAADAIASTLLARAMGPANDLFPRWFGTRAWLLAGADPYSPAVDSGIRQAMGGAPGEPLGAFVFGFVYPGYVALLLAPLALLPFAVAATIWLLLAQGAVVGGAWLCWRAAGRALSRPERSALPAIVAAIFFPASLLNLAFGQFAGIVFVALAGAWLLLERRGEKEGAVGGGSTFRQALRLPPDPAGVLLALSLVKPSLALLPVACLVAWAWRSRRQRAVATFGAVFGAWVAASLLLLPGWPAAFWRSTQTYARVASATSAAGLAASVAGHLLCLLPSFAAATGVVPAGCVTSDPWVPAAAQQGLTAGIAAAAGAAVALAWCRSRRDAGAALATGALLGAWLVPPLYEWNSVLLLVPLLSWLRMRRPVWPAATGLILAGLATLPLVARWPSESRLVWPVLALAAWLASATKDARGTRKVTLRAGRSPSSPAAT